MKYNQNVIIKNYDFNKVKESFHNIEIVKYLSENKIRVVSHIGVTPQKFSDFKKIKSVGKQTNDAKKLLNLATKLEKAGSKFIVLECINETLAKKITNILSVPTIGIGSSKFCDGQVLVIDDILNFNSNTKKPKFIKNFTNVEKSISKAVNIFVNSVKNKKFPLKKHSYR